MASGCTGRNPDTVGRATAGQAAYGSKNLAGGWSPAAVGQVACGSSDNHLGLRADKYL